MGWSGLKTMPNIEPDPGGPLWLSIHKQSSQQYKVVKGDLQLGRHEFLTAFCQWNDRLIERREYEDRNS